MKIQASSDLTRTLIASFFIVILAVSSVWIMRPFLPGIIWAATLVVATWQLMISLERRLNGRRGLAVTIMMVAIGLLVIIPIGFAVSAIVGKAEEVIEWSRNMSQMTIPPPPPQLRGWTFIGAKLSEIWEKLYLAGPENLATTMQPYIRSALAWFFGSLGSLGLFLLNLLVTLIVAGVFYTTGDKAAAALTRFARRVAGDSGENSVILAGGATKAVAMGIVVTTLIQSALAWMGLVVAGVPNAGVITAVVVVFCVAQVGPLIPLLAGVAWLYYAGQNTTGTLFLIWALAVGILDNFLRPILIRRGADLPFLLIFSGVVGGLLAFGVVGLFIGPVVLAVTYRLLQAWVEGRDFSIETTEKKIRPPLREQRPLDH